MMKNNKRNSIREDLLFFAIPAVLIFFAGLVVSFFAPDSLVVKILELVSQPQSIKLFSFQNFLGLFLIITGFIVLKTAQITLGKSYSLTVVIRKDHQLITHGIYHFTRNPMYLGLIIFSIGIPVFASSLLGLLIMSGLIPVILYRIRLEERLLIEEFGDSYRHYLMTTRNLLPFIY